MTNTFFKKIKEYDVSNLRMAFLTTVAFSYMGLLVFTGETSEEKKKKPALIENLVRHSIDNSDTTYAVKTHMNYETRLSYLLRECDTEHLDVLLKNGISIVLDSRLDAEGRKVTKNSETFNAVLYRDEKILSIADNGGIVTHSLYDNTANHVSDIVTAVARQLSREGLDAQQDVTFIRDVKKYPATIGVKVEKADHAAAFTPPVRP
jgi:hypothetical protein